MTLLLASSSPRRRELLTRIGVSFTVVPSRVDEDDVARRLDAGGTAAPETLVTRLAAAKAREVAGRPDTPAGALVLAADTVVVLDGDVLGKPADPADARRMLARLSGRVHRVVSGVALARAGGGDLLVDAEVTEVQIAPLAPDVIARYVATGEPLDKAGAYAVQGLGSIFVERVHGCYFNVVGLPLARTARLLERFGLRVPDLWHPGNPAVRAT